MFEKLIAQLKAEKMLSNVKTVVCRDICESNHIHPVKKTGVSKRVVNALCEF